MKKPKVVSPFKKRLEQRHPYLFVEYWKEGERPFNWFAEWEHLSVQISDIGVAISHQCAEQRFGDDAEPLPLRKFDENMVPDDIPAEQKKAYLEYVFKLFNELFKKPDSEIVSVISGNFTTEEDRSIGFIRSGESEDGKLHVQRGYISLRGTGNHMGSLWSVNEDEFK